MLISTTTGMGRWTWSGIFTDISPMKRQISILMLGLWMPMMLLADQYAYLSRKQADQAYAWLTTRKVKEIVTFCGCCDNDKPVLVRNATFSVEHPVMMGETVMEYWTIVVNGTTHTPGTDMDPKPVKWELDLAYVYVLSSKKSLGSVLAKVLGWKVDVCGHPTISWPKG